MTTTFGFELIQEREIPEINSKAHLYRHVRTGAQLLSLENDDENKVFAITFRTPPSDSTGIAHIMEHSVLCGSRKYPVKEPFVELMKGSLNTFLNAFTYPDKTCYPVASQNSQDFYNLIDVYVDAVFYPLISPHTLQQEGWHYELDEVDGPLTYKGVVFNEMKGAYSNPDDLLADKARQSLFPDTPYHVDSGGDPRVIPDLTYSSFKAFHEKFYHPSNARIYFYGDDDPQERLRLMDGYLKDFKAIQVDSAVPLQKRFDKPRRVVVPFDPGEGEENNKSRLVVNWMLDGTGDPQKMLSLAILGHILLGTPASPLRKALIDSGLGEDLAGVGLDDEILQPYFSTGLKGIRETATDQVEALILDTLASLARDGIDPETVAASMNTVEFNLRENNFGSFPRGLVLMLRALTAWLHGAGYGASDPCGNLAFEAPLAAIKQAVAGGRYFEDLIQHSFLDNPHRTTLILQPEAGLSQRQDADEKDRLAKARSTMTPEELQAIVEDTRLLKKRQETPDTPEALATIPSLKLEDLDKQNKRIPLAVSEQDGCRLLYHDLFTNGIVYLDVGFDLHVLPQELLPYVPLFGRALVEIGTQTEDFVRLSQRIGRTTGGIHPVTLTTSVRGADQPGGSQTWLFLRGKATVPQAEELLSILRDVMLTVRLDNPERFRQMVLEEKAEKEAMLVPAGHRVVNTRLRALFNEAGWVDEQMQGIESLFFVRQLAQDVEERWPVVLEKLEALRARLVNRGGMLCNVTLDQASWAGFQPQLAAFLQSLPAAEINRADWQIPPASHFEGLTLPAQVNYVGKGADLYRLGYTPHGSIDVITKYLRATWLWERVRVQGGAYGGFCLFNQRSGVLTYISYRDPNLLATLDNYDATARYLSQLDLSQEELRRSIIGAIGDVDAYQLPDAKGYTSLSRYLAGETEEDLQLWRDQILGTTAKDFRDLSATLERLNQAGLVVVLGSQEALAKANAERGDWLEVKKVL